MQAKIWNHSQWIRETNPYTLRQFFEDLLNEAGFKVLSCSDHYFEPQGYTALWLLSESHFAVHTFPEFGKSYIELSSCNLEYFNHFLNATRDL